MRFALLVCLVLASPLLAADRPTSGTVAERFQPLDEAVHKFMDRVDATAATVAVSRNGELLYSHGYGWKDQAKKTPVGPAALLRIASVSKPFTEAAIKASIRAGRLKPDDKAFDLLTIEPHGGKLGDERVKQITVEHLLDHKGGWDRDASFDPMFRTREAARTLGLDRPPTPADMIRWMLTKPLDFAPGEKAAYSNFGYCVLGRVLEAAEKKPYFEAIDALVLKPAGITDVKIGATKPGRGEVWYPGRENSFRIEVMDAHGGLVASAPAVCRFLDHHWISGEPRDRTRQRWTFFGSLPGTTAMARQRLDGVNVVVLLNNRRDAENKADNKHLNETIDEALDAIFKK